MKSTQLVCLSFLLRGCDRFHLREREKIFYTYSGLRGLSVITSGKKKSRYTLEVAKGQLISKAIYGVLDSPKKRTKK